jgi:2-isopropylmalate synthase
VDDKLLIAQKLDELGIDYIEGGWPGSNPEGQGVLRARARAEAEARQAGRVRLHALRQEQVEEDRNVRALVEAGTPVVSIFGKSWDLHVAARWASLEENLKLISETVRTSKSTARKWSTTPSISSTATSPIRITRCAPRSRAKAGADVLCLCDTNGGTLTGRLVEIVAEVRKRFDGVIGIHTHNDSDVAVANSVAAVEPAPRTCRAA